MYGKGGILKLADFGLATHKQTAWSTCSGGTIPYMALEMLD
jgi:hypothetical protein